MVILINLMRTDTAGKLASGRASPTHSQLCTAQCLGASASRQHSLHRVNLALNQRVD